MDCQKIKEIIPAYVKHIASEEEITAIEEHLCICQPCREYLSGILDKKNNLVNNTQKENILRKDIKIRKISILDTISLVIAFVVMIFLIYLGLKK